MATAQPIRLQQTNSQVTSAPATGWWNDVGRRFVRQRMAALAAAVFVALVIASLLAPVIAPYDPIEQFRKTGLSPLGEPLAPSQQFWLGTDGLGRDLLSRLLYGGRISLSISIAASTISVALGLLIGGTAGFVGGKTDFLVMRFVDLIMSMPTFFLTLLLVVLLEPGVWAVITVLSLFSWTSPARIFRSQILTIKQRDFVAAAHCLGSPPSRIFWRHLLPHVLPLMAVYLALGIPAAIFAEASLSFLGLGVPDPMPSWGSMIQGGFPYYRTQPWVAFFPGAAIALTVVSINLVGTGLREAMDPARRK